MNTLDTQIKDYLQKAYVMQLATVRDGQPWICTVHFLAGDNLEFYWISVPTTRHSQEIEDGSKAAIAVVINAAGPPIGIQAEGDAALIDDPTEVERVVNTFVERHAHAAKFGQDIINGTNPRKVYRFTPRMIALFDTQTSPQEPHQEWRP